MPCLAYTHCQPAQLTTVGKRATLWMNELYMDLEELDHQISQLALRGVKGTTGTQASFVELFNGDSAKIKAVEAASAPRWALPRSCRSAARPTAARWTTMCCPPWRASASPP